MCWRLIYIKYIKLSCVTPLPVTSIFHVFHLILILSCELCSHCATWLTPPCKRWFSVRLL